MSEFCRHKHLIILCPICSGALPTCSHCGEELDPMSDVGMCDDCEAEYFEGAGERDE